VNKFQKLFSKLNSQQKKAVTQIEGPILCLAGPGTGKTQVLILRIAEILKRTQMNPYNILCLTFTDTASSEMRQRLISLIGNEGFDATISTFHSFSQSIITEFPDLFGYLSNDKNFSFGDLKPLDDLSRFKIIEKIILKKNWQHLKPAKQNLHYLEKIVKAIAEIKRERLTEKNILADDKKKRSINKKIKRTKELFNFYKLYQKELEKNGFYDYEDMINWVVDEMETNHDLALALQERYQYILIDEYQDSNNAQIALVKNLTSFYGNKANVFAVGDPNQSIYRFQGASDYNIKWFKKHFKKTQIIDLKINYRSSQNLIDKATRIIHPTPTPADSGSWVDILTANTKQKGQFNLIEYENQNLEVSNIAIAIKNLIKNKTKASDIAILVRQNNQINNYLEALARQNIPYQTLKPGNIFESPIIYKILAIYRFLVNPHIRENWGELALYLREIIGLDQMDKLLKTNARKFIANQKTQKGVRPSTRAVIENFLAMSKNLPGMPSAKVMQNICDEIKILPAIIKKPDKLELLSSVQTLFDMAKQTTASSLNFIIDIDSMIRLKISRESQPFLLGEENAVVVQTIHQAKGREYSAVFLPEMQERLWQKNERDYFAFSLDSKKIDKKNENQISKDEAKRLFYVGLTRAKKNLIVSYSKNRDDKKNDMSRLFFQLSEKEKIEMKNDSLSLAQKRIVSGALPIKKLFMQKTEKAYLADKVKNFVMTPTSFNSYIKCPQDFLYKHIFRIPQIKKPALSYGTAVHQAMEIFAKKYITLGKLPSQDFLIKNFIDAIAKEVLDKNELKNLSAQGVKLLENYYEKKSQEMLKPIWLEYDFKKHHIHLDEIQLSGKIDKIEWLDKKRAMVRVVDYKTGRARSENEIRGLTAKKDESYLNQLKFYWLLGQLDGRFSTKWKIGEVTLDFLDDDFRFKRRSFVFSDKEINELKNKIREVSKNIQALKFPHLENSSKPCDWCGK